MNINDLSDQEKSAALLRLCGWRRDGRELYSNDKLIYTFPMYTIEGEYIHAYEFQFIANLYDPADMALALRCIRWGMANNTEFNEQVAINAYHIIRYENGINDTLDEMIRTFHPRD